MRLLGLTLLLMAAAHGVAAEAKRSSELLGGTKPEELRGTRGTPRNSDFPVYPFTPARTAAQYATDGRSDVDADGVVVFDYGQAGHLGAIGRRYNPTFIATYALTLYRDLLAGGDPSLRAPLLKNVDWLLTHHEEVVHGGVPFWRWGFDFDYPYFGAKAPWYSALAQARIVVAFAQAYSLTGDPKYARAADLAFGAFLVPMSEGGLVTFDRGVAWLEEHAGPQVPSSKVLNGHVSALAGLRQYAEWSGRDDAAQLVWMATEAVRRDLAQYDAAFLSWYAQEGGANRKLAPARGYNALHIRQLAWLYAVTGDPLFMEYALRFARYDDPGVAITTAGSTDPVGHGPDGLLLRLGLEYWSHNKFPTWAQLDFGAPRRVHSVIALARTAKSAPRHYEVLLSNDGSQWERIVERRENVSERIVETLAPPKSVRYVRLLIHSDNGNRNTALTGFTALADAIPTVVGDWGVWEERGPFAGALAADWCLDQPGYLIADLTTPRTLQVEMLDGRFVGVTASGSNDLRSFEPLTVSVNGRRGVVANARYRYVKLEFAEVGGERAVRLK